MATAFITHESCERHEMGSQHPESPERLRAITRHMEKSGTNRTLVSYEAPRATDAELERVHPRSYLDQLERSQPVSGYAYLDPDTAINPESLNAARHAAGAVVLATDLVVSETVHNAFCSVRPPGHHAEKARAMGFCILNNIAVGVMHAIKAHGLRRIAVADFDVHHGNGTEQILADNPQVLMVSTFQHPLYPYCGMDPLGANMINIPLSSGSNGKIFREAVTRNWLPALEQFEPDMIFVSAGFDAHREDPLAGLHLVEDDFAWVTHELLDLAKRHGKGRLVSSLEGGYALSALGRSVVAHVRELIQA